jgi:hypothetical protein
MIKPVLASIPPRFTLRFYKDAGTTEHIFWRLNQDETTNIITASDLTGYSAECQLKTLDPDTCEYSVNAELLAAELALETGNVTLKTDPAVTVANAYGVRINLPPSITSLFTWDNAVGIIFLISPAAKKEALALIEFETVPLSECYC